MKKFNTAQFSSGFTLIEILVVTTIMGLVITGTIASYRNFQTNRILEKASEEIKTKIRLAQSKALRNEKDCTVCGGCTDASGYSLNGWCVDFTDLVNPIIYGVCGSTSAVCSGGETFSTESIIDLDVYDDSDDIVLSISPQTQVLFKTLGGTNLDSSTTVTITIRYHEKEANVIINAEGKIE